MKVFGYIDDFLVIAYHWLDFLTNDTVHKIVFIVILLAVGKIITEWVKGK